jgi:hypothetical protein
LKDNRYKAVKSLIESNSLKGIKEIFELIPLTVVRVDMRINYNTLRRRIQSPGLLTVDDINKLAKLIGVDPGLIIKLALMDLKS